MKNLLKHPLTIVVLIAVLASLMAMILTADRLSDYTEAVESDVDEQRAVLVDLVTVNARNGSDELTDRILIDCSSTERERFDVLLGSLDQNLDQASLAELDRLFGRCGSFFAERKAFITARLERELAVYEQLITQLDTLKSAETEKAELEAWAELVDLESEQSRLFNQLVEAQDNIIQAVIQSGDTSTAAVVEASQSAREVQENLLLASTQAGTLRNELLSE